MSLGNEVIVAKGFSMVRCGTTEHNFGPTSWRPKAATRSAIASPGPMARSTHRRCTDGVRPPARTRTARIAPNENSSAIASWISPNTAARHP